MSLSNERVYSAPDVSTSLRGERVIVYIDGFNLYMSIRNVGLRRCLWLDLSKFANNLLRAHQSLEVVHYFTALVNRRQRRNRQLDFLVANSKSTKLRIHLGEFMFNPVKCPTCDSDLSCPTCGVGRSVPVEKQSDVNLGTQIGMDAASDRFDTAVVVSSDSDFIGSIRLIKESFHNKKVVVYLPPGRHEQGKSLAESAIHFMHINKSHLRRSQLPEMVQLQDGRQVRSPAEWT